MNKYISLMLLALLPGVGVAQEQPRQIVLHTDEDICGYVYSYSERIATNFLRSDPEVPSEFVELTLKFHIEKHGLNEQDQFRDDQRVALMFIKENASFLATSVKRYRTLSESNAQINPVGWAANDLYMRCQNTPTFVGTPFTTNVMGMKPRTYQEKADELSKRYQPRKQEANEGKRL